MKEIYIIRHGETELNRLGIVQGRGVNADLNSTGHEQALAFYSTYKNVGFDKIYTSSLKRTHQTVDGFLTDGIAWEQDADLDELAWGIWEGKSSTEESLRVFKEMAEAWQAGDYDARFEGGESPNEVLIRLTRAFDKILFRNNEQKILICTHGRAMRLFMCHIAGLPLSQMTDFPHQNTTLYKVVYQNGKLAITEHNNINHLLLMNK